MCEEQKMSSEKRTEKSINLIFDNLDVSTQVFDQILKQIYHYILFELFDDLLFIKLTYFYLTSHLNKRKKKISALLSKNIYN